MHASVLWGNEVGKACEWVVALLLCLLTQSKELALELAAGLIPVHLNTQSRQQFHWTLIENSKIGGGVHAG